jgi:6,7-dimethyl-8-ribityllumazine synthase
VATSEPRYAIVVARFYEELADRLVAGATGVLGANVDVFAVPGAFELPVSAKHLADSGRYAGIVCLGAVIRGETDHYDYVCGEATRGIGQVAIASGVPCGFGLLTCDTYEQALARTGDGKRDSGAHAAEAVLAVGRIRSALAGA